MLDNSLKALNKIAKNSFSIKKKKLKKLKISYTLKSFRVLGQYSITENTIFVNQKLLEEVGEKKYFPIFRHEYGHFITHILYPGASAHGKEWKYVMSILGDKNPAAKTNIVSNEVNKAYNSSFVKAECKCMIHNISKNKASRIINKTNKYFCKICNKKIKIKEN